MLASTVSSSVSFEVIVAIVIAVSSSVTFPKSFAATGASFIPVTVISNVLDADKSPSLIV